MIDVFDMIFSYVGLIFLYFPAFYFCCSLGGIFFVGSGFVFLSKNHIFKENEYVFHEDLNTSYRVSYFFSKIPYCILRCLRQV